MSPAFHPHSDCMRPVTWPKPHRLPNDVRQLRRLVLELGSANSSISSRVNGERASDGAVGGTTQWFAEGVSGLCAAIVRTCEEMQLSKTPPLVCGHIRVICA